MPPAASTVTTMASAARSVCSSSGSACRSEAQYTGRAWPPGVLDGRAQRLDVGGVAAQLLGAVVEHGDGRAVRPRGVAVEDAPGRQLDGRLEAVAGEQHGVGQEACSCAEVVRAALREVGVRLAPRRRRGPWTAPSARRPAPVRRRARRPAGRRRARRRARPPRPAPAEEADHDHVGAVEQRGQVVDAVSGWRGGRRHRTRAPTSRSVSEVDSSRITGTAPGVVRGACVGPSSGSAPRVAAAGGAVPGSRAQYPVTVAGPRRTRTGFLAPARDLDLSVFDSLWSTLARLRATASSCVTARSQGRTSPRLLLRVTRCPPPSAPAPTPARGCSRRTTRRTGHSPASGCPEGRSTPRRCGPSRTARTSSATGTCT